MRPKLACALDLSLNQLAHLLAPPSTGAESRFTTTGEHPDLGTDGWHQATVRSPQATPDLAHQGAPASALEEIERLLEEVSEQGSTTSSIQHLERATASVAESHTQAPPRLVLAEVLSLRRRTHGLIENQRRLRHKRTLCAIESALLAHACLLFGDLKHNHIAERYGHAALAFAEEAGVGQALARTALAKTLRWEDRFTESADMARIGFESSPSLPVRVQLASQEANAAALMGDTRRAREALARANAAVESVASDSGVSAWSFPNGRRAIFALSVATHTGDPDAALRAAQMADSGWAQGEPMVLANWAQIRVGAGIAHLTKDSLDGTGKEIQPVLTLPPELRVSTVTAYMEKLDRHLCATRWRHQPMARSLRRDIRDFIATALPMPARSDHE